MVTVLTLPGMNACWQGGDRAVAGKKHDQPTDWAGAAASHTDGECSCQACHRRHNEAEGGPQTMSFVIPVCLHVSVIREAVLSWRFKHIQCRRDNAGVHTQGSFVSSKILHH
jgi:hypothetical protein